MKPKMLNATAESDWETNNKQQANLQQAARIHGPIAGSVALICGSLSKAVAPFLQHVKTLGMPDVSL